MKHYIFITGGVLSSLGKGITSASLGALLESMGYTISFLKLDPYLNIDPGTMSPYQHGEVFVTDDGAETDLDLGHYERFTHSIMAKKNNATAGKLYAQLLDKERQGAFLGGTVQVVPHFTNEIKDYIKQASEGADITLVEIGGTVGDIESEPFLEAIRQMGLDASVRCLYIHVTYVPRILTQELKTKPTQHSVKELRSKGIQPHIIIGRSQVPLPEDIRRKIALFTNVDPHAVFSDPDLSSIYEAPLYFAQERLHETVVHYLGIAEKKLMLKRWEDFMHALNNPLHKVKLAIVGKYTELHDAYLSLHEAIIHAQAATKTCVDIEWIEAETLTDASIDERLLDFDGILIPGGFGERGVEGKIRAARYAREHKVPYFGICLGMQMAVIEFARNVLELSNAHSTEFDAHTSYPVVTLMPDQMSVTAKGATMRLGAYPCHIVKPSLAYELYGKTDISERHRHRYEFNPEYVPMFANKGFVVSGEYEERHLPEIIELKNHPYFIACQFHPEFKSKPWQPHPLFVGFVEAMHKKHGGLLF